MARWADGVLMVTRLGVSTRDAAREGRETLDNVGGRIVGVVEWGIDPVHGLGKSGYYGNYYGSYHSRYTADATAGRSGKKKGSEEAAAVRPRRDVPPVVDRRRSDPAVRPMGRRIADFVGGLMLGLAAFLAVLLVAAAVLYGLDRVLGWGILAHLIGLLP